MPSPSSDRTLINVIGIPGWIALIWIGDIYYFGFMALATLIGLWEFYKMGRLKNVSPNLYIGFSYSTLILLYYIFSPSLNINIFFGFIIVGVIWLLIEELFHDHPDAMGNMAYTVLGIVYVPILLGTAIPIRQFDDVNQVYLTFALIVSVWACDSAAFFFGSHWGEKKIFPRVSPKKSYVGSISGLGASFIVISLFQYFGFLGSIFTWYDIVIITIITGVFGQIGDFAESLIKRDAGVKDSGTILRGHGGVLDRFDSLIFAMPIAYLYIQFLGLI